MMNIAMAAQRAAAGNDLPEASSKATGDYTRIGDMAREFGVTLRALRFYEDKGLLTPARMGTTRLYTADDKRRLQQILLGRKIGFSLNDIKEVLDLHDPRGANEKQFRLVLKKSQRQMARLEKQHQTIEEAIADLRRLVADVSAKLHAERPASDGA
ncbi:MerR family transcriptional regulator [Nitratireductor soli]|uniref:MerR family transcriptional regulator n=1 Tax=Nitratireductor soli TaxID=1670619 RepID=UPI00065E81CE|nr:MerR family DNA-binding transcriptional regulator [Nitratireductor soli]